MWQKKIKKTIFTLNVDGYSKDVTDITYPLIQYYANKIGADFHVITERKFPEFPPVYEKLQIYELAQKMENDWNIYLDSDTLVHPEAIDFTEQIHKDTILHNAFDMASIRWKYDRFFLRDGRNLGACNWLAIASDWCIELWKPLDDLTYTEALSQIKLSVAEANTNFICPEHLIDDFTLSRNIAKYGLKTSNIRNIMANVGFLPEAGFFWHQYTVPTLAKPAAMIDALEQWGAETYVPGNIKLRILELRKKKQQEKLAVKPI